MPQAAASGSSTTSDCAQAGTWLVSGSYPVRTVFVQCSYPVRTVFVHVRTVFEPCSFMLVQGSSNVRVGPQLSGSPIMRDLIVITAKKPKISGN